MVVQITADHGPAVSGAHNTIVTARAGKDLVSSLCAGLLTIGPRFGGALDEAALQFKSAHDAGTAPAAFVKEMRAANKLIMGIGHRIKSITNPDKRVVIIKEYALTHFPANDVLKYALEVEKHTTAKKENLILNVDGAIAVCFVDLLRSCGAFTAEEADETIASGCLNGLVAVKLRGGAGARTPAHAIVILCILAPPPPPNSTHACSIYGAASLFSAVASGLLGTTSTRAASSKDCSYRTAERARFPSASPPSPLERCCRSAILRFYCTRLRCYCPRPLPPTHSLVRSAGTATRRTMSCTSAARASNVWLAALAYSRSSSLATPHCRVSTIPGTSHILWSRLRAAYPRRARLNSRPMGLPVPRRSVSFPCSIF